MSGQRRLAHRRVRAERDEHGQPADPAVQRAVDRGEQQRQRAASGRVGNEHADAAAVELGACQLLARRSRRSLVGRCSTVCGAAELSAEPDSRRLRHAVAGRGSAARRQPETALSVVSWRWSGLRAASRSAAAADPGVRAIARRLYEAVRDLPLICPHGHVDPQLLLDDEPFADPATLLVTPDHYVTRLLHADGVPLEDARRRAGPALRGGARRAWRLLCEHWHVFRGTPVRYWLEAELADDLRRRPRARRRRRPTPSTTQIAARLADAAFRPAGAVRAVRHPVLATTDDPATTWRRMRRCAADPTWRGRVIPTFRPDRYLEPAEPGWPTRSPRLGEAADVDTGDYAGYLRGARGAPPATSSPTARRRPTTATPTRAPTRSTRRSRPASTGPPWPGRRPRPRRSRSAATWCCEMARMSCDDGLVMTLHPGRAPPPPPARPPRGSAPTPAHDIPIRVEFTDALRPAARPVRHPSRVPPGRLHARRDGVVARAGPAGRLLPVGVRRRAVVVSRRARRHAPLPARRSPRPRASRAPRDSSTTPGPSARSRPATTWPAASTPATWPRLVAEHRLDEDEALRDGRAIWSATSPRRSSSCDAARPTVAAPAARRRPAAPVRLVHLGLGNFFRAHQAWYTDRAPDAARLGLSPRSPAGAPGWPPRARPAGRALHAGHPRRPSATGSRWSPASSTAHAADDHDAWLRPPALARRWPW